MNQEVNRLYIPVNIRRRKELVDGFGKKEFLQTVSLSAVGIVVGIAIYYFTNRIEVIVLASIIACVLGVTIFRKNRFNGNMVDKVKEMIQFYQSQRRFLYKYTNIYEVERSKQSEIRQPKKRKK